MSHIIPNPHNVDGGSQNTATSGARSFNQFWYTGVHCIGGISGDKGVGADIDVVKLTGGNYIMKSVWVAMYFTGQNGHSLWTQWGYALNKDLGYINILTTWDFTAGTTQIYPTTTLINSGVPFVFGAKTTFRIANVNGGNLWRYSRNGVDIYEADLTASSMNSLELQIELQNGSPNTKWPLINVKNISTLKGDYTTWALCGDGAFQGNSNITTGLSIYGLAGHHQNAALANAELNLGGSISGASGTLWP